MGGSGIMQRWDRSLDLGLDGNSAEEWDAHVSNIYQWGINLCAKPDKLVWVYNIKEGLVTAMLAYHSLFMEDSLAGTGGTDGYGEVLFL